MLRLLYVTIGRFERYARNWKMLYFEAFKVYKRNEET